MKRKKEIASLSHNHWDSIVLRLRKSFKPLLSFFFFFRSLFAFITITQKPSDNLHNYTASPSNAFLFSIFRYSGVDFNVSNPLWIGITIPKMHLYENKVNAHIRLCWYYRDAMLKYHQ